jgi:hypothetical protein
MAIEPWNPDDGDLMPPQQPTDAERRAAEMRERANPPPRQPPPAPQPAPAKGQAIEAMLSMAGVSGDDVAAYLAPKLLPVIGQAMDEALAKAARMQRVQAGNGEVPAQREAVRVEEVLTQQVAEGGGGGQQPGWVQLMPLLNRLFGVGPSLPSGGSSDIATALKPLTDAMAVSNAIKSGVISEYESMRTATRQEMMDIVKTALGAGGDVEKLRLTPGPSAPVAVSAAVLRAAGVHGA